jgi:hypothetical protein
VIGRTNGPAMKRARYYADCNYWQENKAAMSSVAALPGRTRQGLRHKGSESIRRMAQHPGRRKHQQRKQSTGEGPLLARKDSTSTPHCTNPSTRSDLPSRQTPFAHTDKERRVSGALCVGLNRPTIRTRLSYSKWRSNDERSEDHRTSQKPKIPA